MQIVRSVLILIFTLISFITFSQELQPFNEDGNWGLRDVDGNVVLSPAYENIGWSDGEIEFVGEVIGYQKNGFWGMMNSKGKPITSPLFKNLEYKGGEFFIASTLGRLSKIPLYGILDKKGKIISSFRYYRIEYGYNNQYIVSELQENRIKSGVIIPNGDIIIDMSYQKIKVLDQNQYLIRSFSGHYGVFSTEGDQILTNKYDDISLTANGEFLLMKDGLVGLADRLGNFINDLNAKSMTTNRLESYPVWSIRNEKNEIEERILADSIRSIGANKFLVYRNDRRIIFSSNLTSSGNLEGVLILEILEDAAIVKSNSGIEVLKLDGSKLLKQHYDSVFFDDDYFYVRSNKPVNKGWQLYSRIGSRLSQVFFDELLPQSGNRIRFKKDGYWGMLNFDGTIMIQPKYDTIFPFRNKRAVVETLGLRGLIDDQNQWVIFPYEENLKRLNDQLYVSQKGFHIKFFNEDGNPVRSITTEYKLLGQYIIIAGEKGKFGIMNDDGAMVTSIAYDEILPVLEDELFLVRIDSARGVIDQNERTVVPLNERLEEVVGYSEGLIAIRLDGKYGFVNLDGQLRIANRYDDIRPFSGGLAPYKLNGKWGFLNKREQLVIQPVYTEVLPFFDGVAAVRENNRWGLIDLEGENIEPFNYIGITRLESGKYLMKGEKGYGLNDEKGRSILLPVYQYLEDLNGEKAIIRKNHNWGVINYNGTYVIPTLYKKVLYDYAQNKFLVMEN